ncbi:MAG: hypothetical protein QG671_2090 [Actinomycetota bacterium]|nr:hypothetical protein [Actinomycetota bacterium]
MNKRVPRFFVGPVLGPLLVVGLSAFLCHALTSWLRRLYGQPQDLVELTGHQLRQLLLVAIVGAGTSALLTARHHARGAGDLWRTAGVSQLRLAMIQTTVCAALFFVIWGVFLVVTGVHEGTGGGAARALPVLIGSFAVVAAPCALGAFIGTCVPGRLAVPTAVVTLYVSTLVVAGAGEDTWWGWLAPATDVSLDGTIRVLWIVGRTLWFSGCFLGMVVLTAWFCARSLSAAGRLCPVLAGALLVAGAGCLAANGPDPDGRRSPALQEEMSDPTGGAPNSSGGAVDEYPGDGVEDGTELWPPELRSIPSGSPEP